MATPAKILFLQPVSEIGGSDIALLRIVERLDRRRFQPCILLPGGGPLVETFRGLDCDVFIMPEMLKLTARRGAAYLAWYLINYPRAVWKIARLVRREGIALVHTNSLHNLYGFSAALLARRPHLWHAREIVVQSRLARTLERFLALRFSTRLVAVSGAAGALFHDRAGAPPSRLRVIHDSADLERFHPGNDGRRVREDLGLPPDAPFVGTVCRLDRRKGADVFLRAAALCLREFPKARFLVAGGPIAGQEAFAAEIKRLAGSLGLGEAVRFTGWRYGPEEMPAVCAALDVFVLASRRPESFGLALLEAMASGKPAVATRGGGTAELCAEGETALLVEPESPQELAQAVSALLRAPARARAMGAAGRRRAEALFDAASGIEKLEALYDEILAEAPEPAAAGGARRLSRRRPLNPRTA